MVTYPDTWKDRKFVDFLKIKSGASPRPIEKFITTNADGINWIKIGDGSKNNKYITATVEKITPEGQLRSVSVSAGDFLLSNSMSFGRPYILAIDGCIHDGWLRLSEFNSEADPIFLYYLLSSPVVQEQYESLAAGSGVQNLNKDIVKNVTVCLPDIYEQKAIADALSQFDEHISNLNALLEKKRNIRKGMLHDLTSGSTRLEGFKDVWTSCTVGDCAQIYQGGTPNTNNPNYWGGDVIWVTPGELTHHKCLFLEDSERKITEEGIRNSSACLLPAGTILLCTRATIGELAIASKSMSTNQGFKNLVCKECVNNVFFAYLLLTLKDVMLAKAYGTTFLEISKKELSSIELKIPSFEEQCSIAEALMEADAEIDALEEERDKMIQIRDGAMDDLLTGRVRLDYKDGCHA